jgi:dGTPase
MREHGGFEHNLQSLRTVDLLEERYAAFDGLNLCFETREGIVKHCSLANARQLGKLGERFLSGCNRHSKRRSAIWPMKSLTTITMSTTGCARADHAGTTGDVSLFARHCRSPGLYPNLGGRRLIHETIRRMINTLVCDLIEATAENLARHRPRSLSEYAPGAAAGRVFRRFEVFAQRT